MVYIGEGGLLTAWKGSSEIARIPEGVTTIGKGAFRNNTVLRSAILPTSLKTIGDMAFESCRSLEKVVCLLTGGWAKRAGGQYEWRSNQILYWQGKPYPRRSDEYGKLLDRLYDKVFEQDAAFRADLASLQGQKIDHRMGLTNPTETVLTRMEFVKELQRLIEKTL